MNDAARDDAYKYNGKEWDETMGLYDYGARWYDPVVGRWGQVDPLAEKYVAWSPYNYVLGNPMRLVDPDGMQVEDNYRLNQDGTIELIAQTDDATDKLFAYHLDGEPTGEVLEVEKGILQEYDNNEKSGTDLAGNRFSSLGIANDETAQELFEFMAENTIVEFSHIKYGDNENIIATTHKSGSEGGGNKLAYDKIVGGEGIREMIHSHPTDGAPSPKDKSNAGYWQGLPGQEIKMTIYLVISRAYREYNKDGFIE